MPWGCCVCLNVAYLLPACALLCGTTTEHVRCLRRAVLCPPAVRRAVPLAMALLNVSDPGQQVVDALSRLSHDADTEVSWVWQIYAYNIGPR